MEEDKDIDIVQARIVKMRIVKGLYGVLEEKHTCMVITSELQTIVDQNYGGFCLHIPRDHIMLPFLSVVSLLSLLLLRYLKDPAPGREKKLLIEYQFNGKLLNDFVPNL